MKKIYTSKLIYDYFQKVYTTKIGLILFCMFFFSFCTFIYYLLYCFHNIKLCLCSNEWNTFFTNLFPSDSDCFQTMFDVLENCEPSGDTSSISDSLDNLMDNQSVTLKELFSHVDHAISSANKWTQMFAFKISFSALQKTTIALITVARLIEILRQFAKIGRSK